ncbi:MAG: glycosyltransferase family 4 protein [Planctomycetota bacterium]|nr:glycosyltransferase family 4 protein [Planctomycetota bacterium]
MRILILNQCFYPDVVATAQHGWDLARALTRRGHRVTAIASRSVYGSRGASLPASETVEGIEIIRVGSSFSAKGSIAARVVDFALFFLLAGWKSLTMPRQDAVVCMTTPPFIALVGWLMRIFRGTRLVYWVMDLYPDLPVACGVMRAGSPATRLFEAINRFLLRRADRVVVLGRCMEDRVLAKDVSPDHIARINVWSDQEEVKPVDREANTYRKDWNVGDRLLVMYSGNFGIGHDIETIADGIALLSSDQRILFALVGGGKRKSELISRLQAAGINGYIDAPYQPRERLDELLSAADVHLATLRRGVEGIMVPSKLYGVLAAERPMVFVGSPEGEVARVILEERCGVVLDCGDASGFARALEGYASDRSKVQQDGERGRLALTQKWSAAHALSKWVALLESTNQKST